MSAVRTVWDVAAWGLWAWALVVAVRRSSGAGARRWLIAAGRVAVVVLLTVTVAGWSWPLGAALVVWRSRRRRDPFALPMADGGRQR
jgi:hypothetical protein